MTSKDSEIPTECYGFFLSMLKETFPKSEVIAEESNPSSDIANFVRIKLAMKSFTIEFEINLTHEIIQQPRSVYENVFQISIEKIADIVCDRPVKKDSFQGTLLIGSRGASFSVAK